MPLAGYEEVMGLLRLAENPKEVRARIDEIQTKLDELESEREAARVDREEASKQRKEMEILRREAAADKLDIEKDKREARAHRDYIALQASEIAQALESLREQKKLRDEAQVGLEKRLLEVEEREVALVLKAKVLGEKESDLDRRISLMKSAAA